MKLQLNISEVQHPNPKSTSPVKVLTQSEVSGLNNQQPSKKFDPLHFMGITDEYPDLINSK